MISAIINQGLGRFEFVEKAMNTHLFIGFMERLLAESSQQVFLILDNLKVHRAKLVKAWLAERKDRIEVFYLPAVLSRDQSGRIPELGLQDGSALVRPGEQQKGASPKGERLYGFLGQNTGAGYGFFKYSAVKYAA